MASSAASPWDKGERLAKLVAARRTLLVLDGVEPLQYPPGPVGGKLKDPAIESLLKGLAQQSPGLSIVTTREPLTDLDTWMDKTLAYLGNREHPHDRYPSLSHLSEEAGARLLFDAGVDKAGNAAIQADDKELKDAAREVGGHALTLQLLGGYLARSYNGDVRKRDLVGFRKADAKTQGGHAFRMLAAYERWFTDAGEEGQRQLAALRLLGLFDRPADARCLAALRQEPAIEGLTESIVALEDDDWNYILSNLRDAGLIAAHADDSAIDAHPLVREHFARQLGEEKPEAWQTAHRRLYEHLAQTTEHQPDTLAGLQPLYQAVAHACFAGMHQQACDEVYDARILRGSGSAGFYSTRKLGACGSDLAGVACFFERPWAVVSQRLSDRDQAWLLAQAAFHLRALGRLTEALEPIQAAVDMRVRQEDWANAANTSTSLSSLNLKLGDVPSAIRVAEEAVELAGRSGDAFWQVGTRAYLANTLFESGQPDRAVRVFREAEAMQAERQRWYPLLYSLGGFLYCDLLLAPAERVAWQAILSPRTESREPHLLDVCDSVAQRANQTLGWMTGRLGLLDEALDHLSLGRTNLYTAILAKSDIRDAKSEIEKGVAGLRRAGQKDELPNGLFSRALLRFVEEDLAGCKADLDEAWQIAERGSMKLFMADVHLYRARLFHNVKPYPWDKDIQGNPRGPKDDLAAARQLIDACGYHRRDPELQDAEQAAQNW
jgi:tetratricopeptide (TPR) repeat protein